MKIMTVFGTRPEAIKMAPLVKIFEQDHRFDVKVIVTAQHREMLDQVLKLFSIKPHYDLDIMKKSQSLGHVTTSALIGLEEIITNEKPDLVLVHGDTTTTFSGALASFYCSTLCAHVEAGLRSGDMNNPYPEEANRILTDHLCQFHFAPTESAQTNLINEGVSKSSITVTGNTVVDALYYIRRINEDLQLPVNVEPGKRIITVTMHRRESWGKPLESVCRAILRLHTEFEDIEIIFPWHLNPRVRELVSPILSGVERIHLIEPLDYQHFLNLMNHSYAILTDSGGIQEEAASLSVPVILLRDVTERPEAINCGITKLTGTNEREVFENTKEIIEDEAVRRAMIPDINPFGDGKASERIKDFILEKWGIK